MAESHRLLLYLQILKLLYCVFVISCFEMAKFIQIVSAIFNCLIVGELPIDIIVGVRVYLIWVDKDKVIMQTKSNSVQMF